MAGSGASPWAGARLSPPRVDAAEWIQYGHFLETPPPPATGTARPRERGGGGRTDGRAGRTGTGPHAAGALLPSAVEGRPRRGKGTEGGGEGAGVVPAPPRVCGGGSAAESRGYGGLGEGGGLGMSPRGSAGRRGLRGGHAASASARESFAFAWDP